MNRLRGLVALLVVVAAAPLDLSAQQKQPQERAGTVVRIGMLSETTPASSQGNAKAFIAAMQALGWVEGRNVVYDRTYADDDVTRVPALAAELIARRPDLIHVTATQPALAAAAATRTIPIVFVTLSDPLQSGLVKSLAHPGANVTGVTSIGAELGGKRLQLLKQAMPRLARVGVLVNPSYSEVSLKDFKAIQEAAAALGVTAFRANVSSPADLAPAFALFAKNRVEAVLATQNPFISREHRRILDLAGAQRLPVVGTNRVFADSGALLAYGALGTEQWERAAVMIDKVLKGAKPADIPVEQPTKFVLAINMKAAMALGITIPQAFLVTADRVIE